MKQVWIIIGFLFIFLLLSQWLRVKDYKESVYFDWNPKDWRQQEGLKDASGKRVVFTGLCRNCENVIGKNLEDAMEVGKYFRDYRIVLFENDSSDRTREIIKEYAEKNDKIVLLECPEDKECRLNEKIMIAEGEWSSFRMNRMADFRQRYLSYVNKHYRDWDYMMVIDWDYKGSLPLGGIMDSLSYPDWDVMVANGRSRWIGPIDVMYDPLAYVDESENIYQWKDKLQKKIDNMKSWNISNMKILSSHGLMKVKSAFNGLAIYNIKLMKNKVYEPGWKCEHIGFHSQFSNIYINPYFKFFIGSFKR